jgi:hypothetical protein
MILHVRQRGPRRTGHFSSSGYYYKGRPSDNDPRRFTLCGDPPTDHDRAWGQRKHRQIGTEYEVCGECIAITREVER